MKTAVPGFLITRGARLPDCVSAYEKISQISKRRSYIVGGKNRGSGISLTLGVSKAADSLASVAEELVLFKLNSAAVFGINAFLVKVEVDLSVGQSLTFMTVGLPDAAVKESHERVSAAIRNCGFEIPRHHYTINLAPADIKKEGSAFDLPIAVGMLGMGNYVPKETLDRFLVLGELSLDGEVRPIRGALAIAMLAKKLKIPHLIVPKENAKEAAVVRAVNVHPVKSLPDVVNLLRSPSPPEPFTVDCEELLKDNSHYPVDYKEVKGQFYAKRALEVAAAGGHNILMIGPPGSGKTMLARRIPTILPPMSFEEAIETTKIHSVAGFKGVDGIIGTRPFRAPHHTISDAGLIGGGVVPRPGEVSLAHNGMLFLDELPEFHRNVLEVLRQPLEDGQVTIVRASMALTFPARFMLSAAMNPCPCGFFNSPTRECQCTPPQIQRYVSRISGPLLDRIDIHIDVPAVPYKELASESEGEPSLQIRQRVLRARQLQLKRFSGEKIFCNAQMMTRHIRKHCKIDSACEKLMENAITNLGLSARAYDRILKVARTIADLAEQEKIASQPISEAIQYRTLDRNFWV